jgi:hypothetical protein
MEMVRLAFVGLKGKSDPWDSFEITRDSVTLRVLARVGQDGVEQGVLVGAYVPLDGRPEADGDNLLLVPSGPRREAERTIETVSDQIAVLTDRGRSIASINPSVAFKPDDAEELEWLRSFDGISGLDRLTSSTEVTFELEPELLTSLGDREDGTTLLADVLSASGKSDSFRGLVRVFERAFGASSNSLVVHLAEFMESRPGLGYTKTEVKRWITKLRGPAVHANRHELPVEADFRSVVPRMKFAAYDVLFNKEFWGDGSSARRDVWHPTRAPRADGGVVVLKEAAGAMIGQIVDPFGAYPLRLQSLSVDLPDDHWPSRGPRASRGPGGTFEVATAETFAVHLPD